MASTAILLPIKVVSPYLGLECSPIVEQVGKNLSISLERNLPDSLFASPTKNTVDVGPVPTMPSASSGLLASSLLPPPRLWTLPPPSSYATSKCRGGLVDQVFIVIF